MSLCNNEKIPKVVVFDLDETLGYFTEFGVVWSSIKEFLILFKKIKNVDAIMSQSFFNNCLELYPEFIRPNILPILNYLKHKRESNECNGVMIYTNNQGPDDWSELIKTYFEQKISYPLFERVIGAFKKGGKRFELNRTTHKKTFDDFIFCARLPRNIEVCFVDDMVHPHMVEENVYYININQYKYNLPLKELFTRLLKSKCRKEIIKNNEDLKNYLTIVDNISIDYTEKNLKEYELDKIISKKTMFYLQTFFNNNWRENNTDTGSSSSSSSSSSYNLDDELETIILKPRVNRSRTNKHKKKRNNRSAKNRS